ncbi:MAG: OmpA family protein [Rhodobacteraceae bacterium]|nr:OmpA family protein [Paracoccaceae bacterium]
MTKTPFFLAAVSLVALSACTDPATFNPDAPDQNRTRQGAIAGAIAGAILGASDTDREARGALIGAAVGAGAGALIGQQIDRQEEALRAQLSSQVQIIRQGNQLVVRMPQDILFDVNSASLRPALQGDIRSLAANLQNFPDSTVTVIGHTDSDGPAEFNQSLSQRRAESVAGILLGQGVAAFRIRAFGRGESEPIATNLTPEGKQQNRRVDIIINPTS